MPFTKEELAAMAAADAEIEANFRLTNQDLRRSRELDRLAHIDALDPEKRKVAASKKAWYEANREKVAASQKAYREANREKYNAYHRAYYHRRKEANLCRE